MGAEFLDRGRCPSDFSERLMGQHFALNSASNRPIISDQRMINAGCGRRNGFLAARFREDLKED